MKEDEKEEIREGILCKWELMEDSINDIETSKYFIGYILKQNDEDRHRISVFMNNEKVYICELYDRGKLWDTTFNFYRIPFPNKKIDLQCNNDADGQNAIGKTNYQQTNKTK